MGAEDPLQGYRFSLEVGDLACWFTGIDGLGSENEIVQNKTLTKDGKEVIIKSAGRLSFGDVTLKRGLTSDLKIWEWRQMVIDGKMSDARKDCTITLYSSDLQPIVRWMLQKAWPAKVSATSLSSDSNDFVMEEMTLAHEGVTREGVAGQVAATR